MQFVDVYSKRTGKKRTIPAHWLDIPSLMQPFRKTPKQKRADTTDSKPEGDESPRPLGSPDSAPVETTDPPHDGDNDKE